MTEESEVPEIGHRLHPLSPLFAITRSFFAIVVSGLVVLALASGNKADAFYMVFFIPVVAQKLLHYFSFRYRLTKSHVVVREGIFFVKTRHIPYARIQNVDTVQNPLHRLFRVVEARLETASGKEPEAVFRVVSLDRLREIRRGVLLHGERHGATVSDPEAPTTAADDEVAPRAFFRMRKRDVLMFGLLQQKGLAYLAGGIFLFYELGLFDRLGRFLSSLIVNTGWRPERWQWVVLGLLLLVALQALTVLWAFVTLFDFRIERRRGDLRTTCGLWTRQTATLPRDRIQYLAVESSLLQRLARRLSVRVVTAGGDSTGQSQISRKWLVPLVERSRLARILPEVEPGLDLDHVDWLAVHPRARRRMVRKWSAMLLVPVAFLAWRVSPWALAAMPLAVLVAFGLATLRLRRLGYRLVEGAVVRRDGIWTVVRAAVRFTKIQSVSLTQTPFDRRHGMATVRVDTAGASGGEHTFAIPYLDLRIARRLLRTLERRAAAVSFRW